MTIEQYDRILRHREGGYRPADIAGLLNLPYDLVYNVCKGRVKRPGAQRRDAGVSVHTGADLAVEYAKRLYLMQGRLRGNLYACIEASADYATASGAPLPKRTLARLVYTRAKEEHWRELWTSRKQQHAAQAVLPKMHYDTYGLVPFMGYWVIDGRKSDAWVRDENGGAIFMPQGFYIMELKTGAYLRVAHDRHAFNARQVALLMLETALEYGPPTHGVLCDNGMEQIGKDNVQLFELFWPQEIIEMYRRGHGVEAFHDIYPGATSPVVTSLPRIPTEFAKARLERSFLFLQQRFDALTAGTNYQGGGRNDVVHTTLKRAPTPDATWPTLEQYSSRMHWFLTAAPDDRSMGILPYSAIERPMMLGTFQRDTGMAPTIGNAMAHCLAAHVPGAIPEENYWRIAYHALDRFDAKRVTALGEVSFQSRGIQYRFNSGALTLDYLYERVDVAVDPHDDTKAGIWHKGQFLGTAVDYSRRVNTHRISIASGKDAMGDLRGDLVRDMRRRTQGMAITPELGDVSTPPLVHGHAINIEEPLGSLDSITQEIGLDVNGTEPELSEETREMLNRIKRLN